MPGSTSAQKQILLFTFAMMAANATAMARAADSDWTLVYRDNYNYAAQDPNATTFNSWMWREDCNGNHVFQDTQSGGCSAAQPCVKLTAEVYDAGHAVCNASLLYSPSSSRGGSLPYSSGKNEGSTPYINAEMYNNACVRQGPGQPQPQDFDRLLAYKRGDKNAWVQTTLLGSPIIPPFVMYEELRMHCDMPYPYDPAWQNNHPVTPYAANSWNTTTPGALYANPLAYGTAENAGMWFRDLAWNAPYLADKATSQKIEMRVKAEGDSGGTRGWGFWNTTMNPFAWEYAWFMEFTNPVPADSTNIQKTLLAMTVTKIDPDNLGGGGVCMSKLPDDVYKWHDYSIIWSAGAIEYRIDQQAVATHSFAPDSGMAFHNWVDNRNYLPAGPGNYALPEAKSNLISSFEVYRMTSAASAKPPLRVSASPDCTSWQTIIEKVTGTKKPVGKDAEKKMAKDLAAGMKSLKDLTALLMKLGVM